MRLLISGGLGYLGGRLAQWLVDQSGYEIVLGSRKRTPPPWLPQVEMVQTQWDNQEGLGKNCVGVDAIVHLAGMNAQDCAASPVAALEVNGVATARLLHAAIRQGVKRFIYLSTAHVYGSPLTGVISEETCPISTHPYATSHRSGEDVVRASHNKGEIEGIVIRLSNAYGAPTHKNVNCWMLLVNDLCRQAATEKRIVLQTSGLQKRDFITLTDACRAIEHLLQLPASKLYDGLFNVGGCRSQTVLEMTEYVARRIYAVTGNKIEIQCKKGQNTGVQKELDYRMLKLIDTGFSLRGMDNADQEIDRLINFCRTHFI